MTERGAGDPARTGAPAVAGSNWNLPNALTLLRIVLVPFFGWALLVDGGDSVGWRVVSFVLFGVAMATDKLDGDLARSRGEVTDFGKIADPIADKAMTGMAFVGLSLIGQVWWWVTVVVIVREAAVTLTRMVVRKRVVIAADRLGKAKTMFQAIGLGLLVLPTRSLDGALEVPGTVVYVVGLAVLAVAVALTLVSGVQFFRQVATHLR